MTRLLALCSAALIACSFAAAQNSPPPPAAIQTDATSTGSPEIRQFQQIEDKWSLAINQHDQYGLELVLSPLLVNVAADGDISTRDQQVVQTITNDDKLHYLAQKVIAVRMLGDIAVVNGTYTLRHRVNSSEVVDKGVFTHVFQQTRGGWMCVNSQRTLVREDSNAKNAKNKSKKSSSAALPFHIPIFMKGGNDSNQ
ncbi:MAG TPA: nuclear transport factor 2 family protein [Terracidiphilus sp.]|nr:nuclear transport factor 2 family protein [Terracidiphilus sp.]